MTGSRWLQLRWGRPAGLPVALLLTIAGCTNEPATGQGSWVEILEIEQAENALDVENHPDFVDVEEHPDRLIFRFDGESPLRINHIVGASGPDRAGYLRRVVALNELPDGRIEAMTEQAFLSDYYPTLHFIVHYDPVRVDTPHVVDLGDGVGGSTMGLGEGCEDRRPCDITGGQTWGDETAGCTAAYGGTIFAGPFVEADFTAELEFDHGISIVPPEFKPDAYFVLDGNVRAGLRLEGTGSAELSCDADFAALLGGGEAPQIRLAFLQVGPIPITISATPVLSGQVSAAADVGEFSAEAGAEATAMAEFGFQDGGTHMEQEFTFEPFADVTTSRAGALSAHAQVTVGIELELQVGYDFDAGPGEVDLGGVGTVDIVGTLGADFMADGAGCSWNVEIPWSCDLTLGVGFDATASVETPEVCAPGFLGGGCIGGGDVGIDWTPSHDWATINIAEGSLGSLGGPLPWCGMAPEECDAGGAACMDDLLANSICAGMQGFQSCGGGLYQRCTCTSGGSWSDCGACMPAE